MMNELKKTPSPEGLRGMVVAVAMSGGVDSSTAAAVLAGEGCRVIGLTMRLFCYSSTATAEKSCCNLRSVAGARAVCEKIGAAHYVIDCEEVFSSTVVEHFFREYLSGRTPNPCVDCNRYVKFGYLMEKARALGADYLATGHYARLLHSGEEKDAFPLLARGVDRGKDQSYFLWSVERKWLKRILFPLGSQRKEQVRKLASRMGLPVSGKTESQEVCFIPDGEVRNFLLNYAARVSGSSELHPSLRPGPLKDTRGKLLGEHDGCAFYTVGQRKGLGVSLGFPAYVAAIDAATNTVVLGEAGHLQADLVEAFSANYLVERPGKPFRALVQVRYRQKPIPATVFPCQNGSLQVKLDIPVRAATPGQSLVFYENDVLLGGAVIESARIDRGR